MNDSEIQQTYDLICKKHASLLQKHGVKLPALRDSKGNYIKSALILVRLAKGYPNQQVLSKDQLTDFIRKFYPKTPDVQQARHLAMQSGWNISSGKRGDSKDIPKDSYKLESLDTPYHSFLKERRCGFDGDWESIKAQYGNRCACCGAKEGEKHWLRKSVTVKLQKGHMNPNLPLKEGNIIPQCQICNQPDRNRWIYDKTGRTIEIAVSEDGFRAVKNFVKRASKTYKKEEIIKKIFD